MKRDGRRYRPFPINKEMKEVKMEKDDSLQYFWYRERVLMSRLESLT